jgi:predicted transposase/invertase (TIGR01784 family)
MAGEHDARYKYLFSQPLFVRKLLESFVREPFVSRLDFSKMQRVGTSFVSDSFREKESDIIWKIDFAGSPLYLFLLLEFQSTVDQTMPLRFLRYITEFYQSFHGETASGKLPAVFPVVLYNGDMHWSVAGNSAELIEKTIPEKYIPSFTYYAVIENAIPKETLLRIKNALSAVFYTENTAVEELNSELDALFPFSWNYSPNGFTIFWHP